MKQQRPLVQKCVFVTSLTKVQKANVCEAKGAFVRIVVDTSSSNGNLENISIKKSTTQKSNINKVCMFLR